MFLPKKCFVIKRKCLYILKFCGGSEGGDKNVQIVSNFSVEHIASSNLWVMLISVFENTFKYNL